MKLTSLICILPIGPSRLSCELDNFTWNVRKVSDLGEPTRIILTQLMIKFAYNTKL